VQRRDFLRSVVSVGLLPKAILAQQTATPAPPPPAPVPWTLGLNPATPLPITEAPEGIAETEARFFTELSSRHVHTALRSPAATARQ
jgi:hypothetical protein